MPELIPIKVLAGVEPVTETTESSTPHYTFTKAIRFVNGQPEKIGGWRKLAFDDGSINGITRSIFSYKFQGFDRYIYGTNTRLYSSFGTFLTNITPVKETGVAVANSLSTYYATLVSNPIATVSGSTTLTITDTAHKFQAGDTVTLSGSTAVNGVPSGEINNDLFIRSVDTNSYTVIVATPATSTGSGGGASVVRSSGYVTVASTAHGLSAGDRIKMAGAATFGGITDAEINLEFIVRNLTTNTFDIYTAGTATSSVASGGGASTEYFEPIDTGAADTLLGNGYGVGLYGVGLYGVSKTSLSTNPARLWSHDRFGDLTVSAYNDQSSIYSWDNDTETAPVKVTNSPPANYVFVSNEIVVALGYDSANTQEAGNGISWCDQGGITNWTTGQAGSDVIEGAGDFISQANARGENLLFTENQVYTFRYIGGQLIWQTRLLDQGVGIIGQNARVSVSGTVYWMASNNFYMWRGGSVEVVPSNSGAQTTLLKYVFNDINYSQKEKIFAWYNEEFREIWWHYPSQGSNEPNRVARLNVDDFSWCMDEMDRTAAEYPSVITQNPYLADILSNIYLHEDGDNDDEVALSFQLKTPFSISGTKKAEQSAFIPDNLMSGNITVTIRTKSYPNSPQTYDRDYIITTATDRISTQVNGRYIQYELNGNDLDQEFSAGIWYQEVKESSEK